MTWRKCTMKLHVMFLAALIAASVITGCSKIEKNIQNNMSTALYTAVTENCEDKKSIVKVYNNLRSLNLNRPYSEYGDIEVSDGIIMFNVVDKTGKVLNCQYDGTVFKSKEEVSSTDKQDIDKIVKEQFGYDIDYTVESTYEKGILVHLQGVTYTWKNNTLEMVK